MSRRTWYLAGVLLAAVLLHWPVSRYLAVGSVAPDLLSLFPLLFGLLLGHFWGMGTGFGLGVVAGVVAGRDLDAFAFAGTLSGYLAGAAGRMIFVDNPVGTALATAVLTVLQGAVFLVLSPVVELRDAPLLLAGRALYHGLLAIPLVLLLRRLIEGKGQGA